MNIHDEGMAKMMTIRRLKERVVEVKDSLAAKKADTAAYFVTANAAGQRHQRDEQLDDRLRHGAER